MASSQSLIDRTRVKWMSSTVDLYKINSDVAVDEVGKVAEHGWKNRDFTRRRVDHGNGRSKPSSVRHTSKSFGSDRGHLSYVEISNEGGRYTKGGDSVKEESRKIIKWKAIKEDVEWAEFSVIGVLKFLWDDVLDFVEDHSNWSIYASISKWVRLSGFPIRIWCPFFFNAVGNSFGLTLHIEDRAALKGILDSCRILVAMAKTQECPSSVLIESGSESFRVDVKEVDEAPSDEWIGERLGLFSNSWNPNRSGKVKSPVKKVTSGKLVIFENQNRGRVSSDACGVVADGTTGINVLNSSQFALEVSSSSNGKEYKALPQKGKGSGCNRGHSSCRGARGRGRRRAIILSSHGMRTRKSTQRPFTISVGGPEWEFDDEFTKVIEELVVRGVNLTEPNPCYGEDGGWRVEEEVAKVVLEHALKAWKDKRAKGSKGFIVSVKLKVVKWVFKKWHHEVKFEESVLDRLETRLDSLESFDKSYGWSLYLHEKRCKMLSEMWSVLLKEERNL
ncbi:hypothetical protein LWI29_016492 [Acer saccharum]|uniref:DUF4283 domain-containing protein n=1 Tax=Acer saccharum TaxID=4024 RepID=A0AA39RRQ3_ACESA|nr:hypothetical protein LWI29_016492 [Acer saccharum]